MEFISDRVSVEQRPDGLSVVVSARLPRSKETLLVAWAFAWLCCGAYMMWELVRQPAGPLRTYLAVFMGFWLLYAWRIGGVVLWRLKGFELWRLKDGVFTIKDSVFGYGRANDHFVENMQRFGVVAVDETSWKWQLNDSFWVKGGERLGFEYGGRKVVFGKSLTRAEAEKAARLLERAFAQYRRKTR